MPKKKQKQDPPPTVITLTLPTPQGEGNLFEHARAILIIQRGDLAQVREFHYDGLLDDLTTTIREASEALGLLENNPPIIPDLPAEQPKPKSKRQSKATKKPAADEEPTIDVPLKKGTQTVKLSHIKIVGGETDAAAYRQATQLAGRLIDGKLWDGESPIRFEDVYAVAKKMKHLTDKDFSLFALTDFVEVNDTVSSA